MNIVFRLSLLQLAFQPALVDTLPAWQIWKLNLKYFVRG